MARVVAIPGCLISDLDGREEATIIRWQRRLVPYALRSCDHLDCRLAHRMGSALEDVHRAARWHAIASMPTLPPSPIDGVVRGSQPRERFY